MVPFENFGSFGMAVGTLSIDVGQVHRIAAFADGCTGGNPAGVYVADAMPPEAEMQALAASLGYSETVFAAPLDEPARYRVRYFAPASEVPFCGHATIALARVLGAEHGPGEYRLQLNEALISVEVIDQDGFQLLALQSPPTRSESAPTGLVEEALALFSIAPDELDARFAPALAHAGADHLLLMLRSRESLAAMNYDLAAGREWMNRHGLVTVLLGFAESDQFFHTRNAFASGGVFEDPATGAATAALAGRLRDIGWAHGGEIDVVQGGYGTGFAAQRSLLRAQFSDEPGSSIRILGGARDLQG